MASVSRSHTGHLRYRGEETVLEWLGPRKSLPNPGAKIGSPRRSLSSAFQRTSGGTPRNSDSRSSTPVPTSQTSSPSRSLTGIARDSALTKQADAALNNLESTLQEHTDQLTAKMEQMSARINALDDTMQDLLKDDFDDPDRTSTPRPSGEQLVSRPARLTRLAERERHGPTTATTPMFPQDTGTPLLSEQSPFFTEK